MSSAPGPAGLEIWRTVRRLQRDPLPAYLNLREQYGDVVRLGPARRPLLLLAAHPDHVQHLLRDRNQNYGKGRFTHVLDSLLGQGLLTSEGALWLRQRRLAQPAFHQRQLARLSQTMTEAAQHQVVRWRPAAEAGTVIDLFAEMTALTLDIVTRALFGADVTDRVAEIGDSFTTTLTYMNYRSRHPLALPEWVPSARNRRYRKARTRLYGVVDEIIARRRAEQETGEDLLGLLLAAVDPETGAGMAPAQLRDEVITIMLAGHETTANALTWAFYLLARHPQAARRLREEVDQVLGDAPPMMADLQRLPFLEQVVNEALRLYPPSVVIPRVALAPDELGGFEVPAGTDIILSQYVVHRHPDFWEAPETFRPERFADPPAHRFAYIPFGAGPRQCIGNSFALVEARLILATVLQAYIVELAGSAPPVPEIAVTLRPRDGLPVILRRR